MKKSAIRSFAVWARQQLIEGAKQRARKYGIDQSGVLQLPTDAENLRYMQLLEVLRCKGYEQVMEEAACGWFIRLAALRFMEVSGFLPSGVSPITAGRDGQMDDACYRLELISQCNALSSYLPCLFEKPGHWTELLLPDALLQPDSVIGRMLDHVDETEFQEVEILGWLYQFYHSGKHEEVVDPLHGRVITKEDIPVATQLFTTKWVVQYLVDNSLGRYWLERNPQSALADKLTYLATPDGGTIEPVLDPVGPEELKVLDPCVGSGHFLSYAFDVLMEIYRECGWSDQEAAESILRNNLYGLDIDDTVVGLARFAVTMKARKYHPRILNTEIEWNVLAMKDSDLITDDFIREFAGKNDTLAETVESLRAAFDNATEYGSLISADQWDLTALQARLAQLSSRDRQARRLLHLVRQAQLLSGDYAVVATNPPYLNKYSHRLKNYLTKHFADYKGDLFSVFIFRSFGLCKRGGYCGFMTPMVWMFLKSYEALRKYILSGKSITTLIQFEYSAFEEATVPICAFVLKNAVQTSKSLCFRLSAFPGGMELQNQKVLEALGARDCGYFYEADQHRFSGLPGSPIAYWLSDAFVAAFDNQTVGQLAKPRQGLATGCNDRFVRQWHEISSSNICWDACSVEDAKETGKRWFPYNKGGEFRKWYGNDDYLVNWENDGLLIRNFRDEKGRLRSRPQNTQFYFRPSISWSLISSSKVAFRYKPRGQIFDVAGMSCFADENLLYLLGLCNSSVALEMLAVLAPTINFQAGDIANLPVVVDDTQLPRVERLVEENINISKCDWDAFEASRDFTKHPLI